MKNNRFKKLLVMSSLLLTGALVGCSNDVDAKPGNISDNIVDFTDSETVYFRNTIETIYDNLISSSSTNSSIFDELVNKIAEKEVTSFVSDEKIKELCEEIVLNDVKGNSTYNTNSLFDEEKYVLSLKVSNPGMNFGSGTYTKDYLIQPEDKFEDVFKADYSEYIEKKIKPGVMKKLLIGKYLCQNSVSSLSRANARDVQYIKLENFQNKVGEVNRLIIEWLGNYISNPTDTIDFDELQAIYKGIKQDTTGLTGEELERANRINDYISRYYTLASEIDEDLAKIVKKDESGNLIKENGHYVMLDKDDTDQTIEDKYTGSGTYTIEWGEELALRSLAQKDLTGNDIYTKSVGISDLTSDITDRLFSSSIASYVSTAPEGRGVKFLTPKTTLNGSDLSKYYFYDSSTNAYYIVAVNQYYTTSVVNKLIKDNTDDDGNITYSEDLVDISYSLADSSTNQRQALIYFLKKYNVGSNIHDDTFYEYIVDTYSEIIK